MGTNRPICRLVVSNSTVILRHLRAGGFRRIDLRVQVAQSVREVLDHLMREQPDAVILEAQLSDGDGFELCRTIKAMPEHAELPVIIVCEGSISRSLFPTITACGCDEVLSAPLSRGQLYQVLAERFNLPRRRHYRVNVRARVTTRDTYVELKGETYDIAVTGARIRLSQPFTNEPDLRVCVELNSGEALTLDAAVVWHRPHAHGSEIAVQFKNVTGEAARQLEGLATWRVEPQDDQQWIILQQNLTERSNFDGLTGQLAKEVFFDLRHLALINSVGVSRWIAFLRQMPDSVVYHLAHCSVAFCAQASFVPDMVGRGDVISFYAPYYCPTCDCDLERELHAASLQQSGDVPAMPCPTCGQDLVFEDVPERYLSFLRR